MAHLTMVTARYNNGGRLRRSLRPYVTPRSRARSIVTEIIIRKPRENELEQTCAYKSIEVCMSADGCEKNET